MIQQMLLPELVKVMLVKLAELHYADNYINLLRAFCNKLIKYAEGIGAKYMTEDLKSAFMHDLYASHKKNSRNEASRCADMLLMVQEF